MLVKIKDNCEADSMLLKPSVLKACLLLFLLRKNNNKHAALIFSQQIEDLKRKAGAPLRKEEAVGFSILTNKAVLAKNQFIKPNIQLPKSFFQKIINPKKARKAGAPLVKTEGFKSKDNIFEIAGKKHTLFE